MKKLFKGLMVFALVFVLVACGGGNKLADGKYQAGDVSADNGWTSFVTFDVKEGKMENFKFDSVNLMTGDKETKAQQAAAGKYVMDKGDTWDVQAKKIESYVMEKQGMDDVKFDAEGKTDAIAGATIHYGEVAELIKAAKEAGPVEKGTLNDGVYFAEDPEKDKSGFNYTLGYFVSNGKIISSHADAYKMEKVDGKDTKVYKTVLAKEGKYDLGKDAAGAYNEQAAKVDAHIIENQKFEVEVNDEGKTDAISGATISVDKWMKLFTQAK